MTEPAAATTISPDFEGARDAFRRHAWREAFDLYAAADQAGELAGPDLEALADSAWFSGQADVSIATKERAYKAHLAADGKTRAAYLAFDLAREYAAHDDGADLELGAARDEFRRLGARLDAEAADQELQSAAERRAGPIQVRKTFLFTDIVGSTNLAEALGNDAWERLLRWHDDTLRTLFAQGGGEVVNSTGDGFFVAFDAPRPAIDAAIAIQRSLAEHGRTTGFAPAVRIGIHAAEANRRGNDYSGVGVHVAARVAALAGGGEIVATSATAAQAGNVSSSDGREATLKGVAAPVEVVTVGWA